MAGRGGPSAARAERRHCHGRARELAHRASQVSRASHGHARRGEMSFTCYEEHRQIRLSLDDLLLRLPPPLLIRCRLSHDPFSSSSSLAGLGERRPLRPLQHALHGLARANR